MLILFALGVMSITWMLVVAGLIFAEKEDAPFRRAPHALLRDRLRRRRHLGRRRPGQRPRAQTAQLGTADADGPSGRIGNEPQARPSHH
jgi:hypothetical protein